MVKKFLSNVSDGYLKELLTFVRTKTFPKWAKIKELSPRNKELAKDKGVVWNIGEESGAVSDHLEMSGLFASAIVSYGKDKNDKLRLNRHISFPSIRLKPNLTSSHFRCNFSHSPKLFLEDTEINNEHPQIIKIRGGLSIESDFMGGARVVRTLSPSLDYPALIEKIEVTNISKDNALFSACERRGSHKQNRSHSLIEGDIEYCARLVDANGDFRSNKKIEVEKHLVPGATAVCYVVYYAARKGEVLNFNAEREIKERKKFTDTLFKTPALTSGNDEVDALFSHCLLRGAESIFATQSGLLHSPGGGKYYAAIWANDQCEYANPFFPYLGYKSAIEQAINCYRLFSKYIDNGECAPSSLVAGGTKPFGVAGDRGDTEMYFYGLCRFLLAAGNAALAEEFYPSLEKAADFILKKKSDDGVIFSDSDELENRFPAGNYNLSTNCLAYDGFVNMSRLSNAIGKDGSHYQKQAEDLKKAILSYFRAEVEGHDIYRYYKGNTELRSWICLPSIVGIDEAANNVYDALFSEKMLVESALKTASSSRITWDRSLLYALRGALLSNHPSAVKTLKEYAKSRLLGVHSPYPYEAYPEGNMAHLSAESVLFARAITEGMFALEALSFSKLRVRPKEKAKLSGIHFGGHQFEIDNMDELKIRIGSRSYSAEGKSVFDFATLNWES
ncbi:MAG: hypothetical protein WC292_06170 [Clostridia bacterium]